MKVPILDPVVGNAPYQKEIEEAALRVLRSGNFIMGLDISLLEAQVSSMLGTKEAIAVSSGTDALILSLMALDIGPGDEVICPTFTFFATAGAIARVGATPVFVDIDYDTFNMDLIKFENTITDKTRAVIPVHLFGQCLDMEKVNAIAAKHNLKVIEDACQAIGTQWNNVFAGSWGHTGCFSFFPTKNIGGFGDGGIVTTNDIELAKKMLAMRVHGGTRQYYHDCIGGNFRMDTLQAAMLKIKIYDLTSCTEKRRKNAKLYLSSLEDSMYLLPIENRESLHVWNQFTIRVQDGKRDELRDYLGKNSIASGIYYPLPLHQQPCFSHLSQKSLPVAEQTCKECLSLPIAAELTELQIDYVVSKLQLFEKGYR